MNEAGKIVQTALQKYGTVEHLEIGNKAFAEFLKNNFELKNKLTSNDLIEPTHCTLYLSEQVEISAGHWVALAGDYYGKPDRPICDLPDDDKNASDRYKMQRFEEAYETLANLSKLPIEQRNKAQNELNNLMQQIEEEKIVLGTAKQKCEELEKIGQPTEGIIQKALEDFSDKANKEYGSITSYSSWSSVLKWVPLGFTYSRYIDLVRMNFDHFGSQAEQAYSAGHAVALATAEEAFHEQNELKKYELILKALTQELFACHYFTDLFASGHMRTPRYELWEYVNKHGYLYNLADRHIKSGIIAGLLAQAMHDEDNNLGLNVTSEYYKEHNEMNEKVWLARGDNCYFEANVEKNNKRICEAVTAALQAIYDRARGIKNSFDYKDYLPKYEHALVDGRNHSPLFKIFKLASSEDETAQQKIEVWFRNKLEISEGEQVPDSYYQKNWDPASVLIQLHMFKKKIQAERKKESNEADEELEVNSNLDRIPNCLVM